MDILAFENTENWERIWWKCLEYKVECLAESSGLLGKPLLSCSGKPAPQKDTDCLC